MFLLRIFGLSLLSFAYDSLAEPVSRAACVPDKTQFYWKTPCDGQTFPNAIDLTNMTATQNGQDVDVQGGLDMTQALKLVTAIVDKYGEVKKPLIDIGMLEYTKGIVGPCEWKSLPTFGLLDNIDSCTIVDNCHMDNHPTTITATIDFKDLAGALVQAIQVGNYYGFTMTFKDDQQSILCVYAQSKVIKKK